MTQHYTENDPLITPRTLAADLERIGLRAGQTVIVHSSLKKIAGTGFVVGGAQAVIEALQSVLTPRGTLALPTHNTSNTDPAGWSRPPVPESWWETIRAQWPAYDPRKTQTSGMGAIPELFRSYPDVLRSGHPTASFAAWGANAAYITSGDPLASDAGPDSTIGRVYELDGYVLLLGVGHFNNTTLHYAEHVAEWPDKQGEDEIAPMIIDGKRERVTIHHRSIDNTDFPALGSAYEAAHPDAVTIGIIGAAESRFMRSRPLVDFGVSWMAVNRPGSLTEHE